MRRPAAATVPWIVALLLTFGGGLLLGPTGCRSGPESESPAVEFPPAGAGSTSEAPEEPEPTVAPLARENVKIYFHSALGNGLIGENRQIFATVTPGDRAKQIIADLISGPNSPQALRAVPAGTNLRQVFVLDSGVAYLDFTADLAEGIGGGSMRELLTVYAIVDSVVLNVPEIRRVAILVDSAPIETLNGHMDLRRPLAADRSLILGSIAARRPRGRLDRLGRAAASGREPVRTRGA